MQSFGKSLIARAQLIEKSCGTGEDRVASALWRLYHAKHRVSRWIGLERVVGMEVCAITGICTNITALRQPTVMNFNLSHVLITSNNRYVPGICLVWITVLDAKVLRQVILLIDVQVLISEEDNTSLYRFRISKSHSIQVSRERYLCR